MKTEEIFHFLGVVFINLKRSELAYNEYKKNGKTFLYASILKDCNQRIREALLEKSYLLSPNLQSDAIALLFHLDVWLLKWEQLREKLKPDLEDEFVFQNNITCPRNSVENLEKEFERLRENIPR
ncbi:hypothetical protein CH373_12500 [Leptospira perolatii]|uniref:Uncharacterized protein n=1 Tax=Leptospira perolatii TaxID=2023191 RepID=A0A2M9ZLB0_9LEPT|nr:hypothetical protein [Leptospira perolatii]PJZ70244.1 hypothetical protein CH360_06470 [Leptospira perolatii]PJZ72872.1 hypothetical protein CH373_12500 [Leptospira perolatii]